MNNDITRRRKSFYSRSSSPNHKNNNRKRQQSLPQFLPQLYNQKSSKNSLSVPQKVPFYDPLGNIYIQIDGISMGSPIAPTISEFYMSHIENKIFETNKTKAKIYIRCVDDVFVAVYSYDKINKLKPFLVSSTAPVSWTRN